MSGLTGVTVRYYDTEQNFPDATRVVVEPNQLLILGDRRSTSDEAMFAHSAEVLAGFHLWTSYIVHQPISQNRLEGEQP